MAADGINGSVSPMHIYYENFEDTQYVVLDKIERLKKDQKTRSPFLVGSIREIGNRISKLDHKLQKYTKLISESRASNAPDEKPPTTAARRERCERRERDEKELEQFAGIYSIKSTFGDESDRVKNVSKISMNPTKPLSKKDSGKPKFVELYRYGGYERQHPTPLPDNLSAADMLTKVTMAQTSLLRKATYRVAFEKVFHSTTSQAILLDTFWWCFLNRFQTDKYSQCQLFRRISFNYVKLLLSIYNMDVKDPFLRDYCSLLAQAVYSTFYEAFPDSFRQFDDKFKEMVVGTISEWIVGTKPAPLSFRQWNYSALVPLNITSRDEIKLKRKNSKTKLSVVNLNSIERSSPSNQSVTSLVDVTQSSSDTESSQGKHPVNNEAHKKVSYSPFVFQLVNTPRSQRAEESRDLTDDDHLPTIPEQSSPVVRGKPADNNQLVKLKTDSKNTNRPVYKKRHIKLRESHPACRAPDLVHHTFNLYGQSPLVAYFLAANNLTSQAGCDVIVQRSEISQLLPSDAETYLDVIREAFANLRTRRKETKELFANGERACALMTTQHRAEMKQLVNKEAGLLMNTREVRRLCDLIILDQHKQLGSLSTGMEAAVKLALEQCSQTVPNS